MLDTSRKCGALEINTNSQISEPLNESFIFHLNALGRDTYALASLDPVIQDGPPEWYPNTVL